jgi:hypothetical protein
LKLLNSRTSFLVFLFTSIALFGFGLTSPIWFILDGRGPVAAMRAGTPIVTATIVGLCITTALGLLVHRLRGNEAAEDEAQDDEPVETSRKDMIVHVVTMLMFIVPFLTIIVGMLLNKTVDMR